ncbi:MAG: hypothetical protein H0X28_15080 [Solirubrobacterales bacterium]|nr:hypothetical protein [Solirubrobacterales bacterium]
MRPATATSTPMRALRIALALGAGPLALLAGGCGTGHPRAIARSELAEAQTFPYYRVYWVGPHFEGHALAATDGLRGYIDRIGDSVYYGDCVQSKGIFGGGSCLLPLQVTTVVYRLHSNAALGPQRNAIVRDVPAVVYDGGRTIELYSGRVAIDVFSDTFAHALRATGELLPVNAPGSSSGPLPAPVYCPGLSGPIEPGLKRVLARLPHRVCQRAAAASAYERELYG